MSQVSAIRDKTAMTQIAPEPSERGARWLWWLLVAVAVASGVAGVLLLARPQHSLNTLAVIFGIFLLFDGGVELVTAILDRDRGAVRALLGVLGIVVGIALIRHPVHGVTAVGIFVGAWLVTTGALRFCRAVVEGVHPLLRSLIGWVEICAGTVIIAQPHIGYTALAIITGIWLVINAVSLLVLAFAIRRVDRDAVSR